MKQVSTLLLMILLAFNWAGYRLFSGLIEHRSDLALEAQIDRAEYNDDQLMEMRVPLNAPYLSHHEQAFQRVDGEIEIDGQHYTYVKRRVENGELVLLCLPNESKSRIRNSRIGFFKLVNDLNQHSSSKDSDSSIVKTFSGQDYNKDNDLWRLPAVSVPDNDHKTIVYSNIFKGFQFIPEQPPKA